MYNANAKKSSLGVVVLLADIGVAESLMDKKRIR